MRLYMIECRSDTSVLFGNCDGKIKLAQSVEVLHLLDKVLEAFDRAWAIMVQKLLKSRKISQADRLNVQA